jgi:hypothetical protein
MTSLYDLYRQHKDAAGAFTGGLPAQNTGGYLNMPETPIPAQQSALASLAPGQMGTPSPGAGYAQVGNRRVTLADIGGQNDPFRGGGSVSVADFGGQKTYSLNPDVQRVGMEMEQQRQADQSMRAGLPNGMTLQEFLQAPFSRGKDQGALMQLYQQMQGAAVQQGQLAHAMRQPEVDPIAMQDRKFLMQQALEGTREDSRLRRAMEMQDRADARQQRYLEAKDSWQGVNSQRSDKRYEVGLRKEFEGAKIVKEYDVARNQMSRIESGLREIQRDPKKAANYIALDQSLVMLFNKMLDPDSVVREGEYARTIQNSPIMNRIAGKLQQVATGGAGFTNSERQAIVNMARTFAQEAKGLYDNHANEYRRIAGETGADPNRVVISREPRGQSPGGSKVDTSKPVNNGRVNGFMQADGSIVDASGRRLN